MARQRDEIDKLYNTSRWRKHVRPSVLNRDNYRCQECKRRNIRTAANIVHHKIEAREDITLFFDENNLEAICTACHNKEHPERSGGEKKKKTKRKILKFYSNNERG